VAEPCGRVDGGLPGLTFGNGWLLAGLRLHPYRLVEFGAMRRDGGLVRGQSRGRLGFDGARFDIFLLDFFARV
jgi:hypothetical protein